MSDAARQLTGPSVELGKEAVVAASQLVAAVKALDEEIAKLARDVDPSEIPRLEEKLTALGHPDTAQLLADGDRIVTYAEISAQNISIDLPALKLDRTINEGDTLKVGDIELEVWHTPGHTNGQLSFRYGDLLLSGDNIYRDGCVGNIDAHHGSDIPDFMESLKRIRDSAPATRVIISTGHNDVGDIEAETILRKPYRVAEALESIRRVLDA